MQKIKPKANANRYFDYDLLVDGAGKLGISGTRFHLLAVLWWHLKRDHTIVWSQYDKFALKMGIHYRNVTKNLNILIAQGFIVRGKRWSNHRELDLSPLIHRLLEAVGVDPAGILHPPILECPNCHTKLSAKPTPKKFKK